MKRLRLFSVAFSLLLLSGCAGIGDIFDKHRPKAAVEGVHVTGFDFEAIELLFDVRVENPNPVGIALAGLDYDFKLQGEGFLQGEQALGLKVPANASSRVQIPFKLGYQQLRSAYQALAERDQVDYALTLGLGFDVPAVGRIRVPVRHKDSIPVPKLPRVALQSIELQRIGGSGAELELQISLQVENPNSFTLLLDQLAYDLELDGRRVGGTRLNEQWDIQENGAGTLRLPLTVDFLQLGNSLYSALVKGGTLDYRLIGAMAGGSRNPQFGRFNLPLEETGTTGLGK